MTGEQWQMLGMRGPALPERKILGSRGRQLDEPVLCPRRLAGHDGIGQLFEYRVEATVRASLLPAIFDEDARTKIDLDRIAGTDVWLTIDLERVDTSDGFGRITTSSSGAGLRHINGVIASACVLGEEGNDNVYEFVVRPSFWLATIKVNSRAYSGPIIDILNDVISPYGAIEWRIDSLTNPQRDYVRQAWESDWDFFIRLCEEWGFVVWIEHHDKAHTLVIADNASAYRKHERAYETLRYHARGGHINEEHINALTLSSTVTAGSVTVQDHSYKTPRLGPSAMPFRETYSQPRDTARARQEVFARADFAQPKTRRGLYYDETNWRESAQYLARVKLEALRAAGLRAKACGPLRGVETGKRLAITHYPYQPGNCAYLVTETDIDISATGTTSASQREYAIESSFVLQPMREPYRMPQTTPRPHLGDEYAVIVGPENAEIYVDEFNRVLVQFDWDREGKYDGKSCIWVRLATSWQGNGMGTVAHARCGQQVLISYVHGDPDRPVVSTFVVDENNQPPWKLPENHALTGIVSKSLGRGTSTNHLALDDTQDRMQAQLASDYGKSSLSLGYNTRIDGNKGRQDARGQGVELRTDLVAVIRAAKGLLFSTWGRVGAAGKAADMGETIGKLTAARDVHENAAQLAQRHGAQDAQEGQVEIVAAMKDANARLRGKTTNERDAFPEFESPSIAISSADDLHTSAAGSTYIASERNTALTSIGHTSIVSGKSLLASALEKIAFYAQKAITIITPGPVHIQSRNGSMMQSAQDAFSITSTNGIVQIAGKQGVDIMCGGTLLRIRPEGITGYTGGNFMMHAADHATAKPEPKPVDYPVTAENPGKLAAHHVLVEDGGGFALQNQPYRVTMDDGQIITGVTNSLGEFQPVTSNAISFGSVELLSQSDPDTVIGFVQTIVYENANKVLSPIREPAMPKRQAKVGGESITTPNPLSTSQGKPPTYITCDPLNFGLRASRFVNGAKQGDVSTARDRRMDIEYPVAKKYTEDMRVRLGEIDWKGMIEKSTDEMADVIVPVVESSIYTALKAGAFGFPVVGNDIFPLPKIVFVGPENFDRYGMKANYSACFNSNLWMMIINKFEVLRIAKSDAPASKNGPMSNVANTIYHEARHCQQKFWMISLWATNSDDYAMFPNLETHYRSTVAQEAFAIARKTEFPNDDVAKIGVHRMLVFDYYWSMMSVPESAVDFRKDLPIAERQVCELLGISADVARKRVDQTIGYKSHLHEEDAYTCGDIVDRYWNHEAYLPNPGACRSEYVDTIRAIGGIGGA
ncbi:type VI secretion system tip protein VgrG [Paraburkholderia sp. Ac-20340]|uniref:type VI secretion system tip protein TssI/VgrG n=1 Tax=Paraburkholderia sp. Ac-20340 TaxID=2703888 RepID=UPI001981D72E|nr:type VI secretion system tip protein TssI/VgrG [Paraburkholderia sp. Ac-20340]MBN3853301.1 type VI secretion system tip protein VgrG [Paraburkholderia sp. Ac-20340]